MTTYKPFDVVEVPFPFSNQETSKRRKALVLSPVVFQQKNNAAILMMITSAGHSEWHGDVDIIEWQKAGLKKPCKARLKIFTLDTGLIKRKAGTLAPADKKKIRMTISQNFSLNE